MSLAQRFACMWFCAYWIGEEITTVGVMIITSLKTKLASLLRRDNTYIGSPIDNIYKTKSWYLLPRQIWLRTCNSSGTVVTCEHPSQLQLMELDRDRCRPF